MLKQKVSVSVQTESEHKIEEVIKGRIQEVVQTELNKCSAEYYRNIKANINIEVE